MVFVADSSNEAPQRIKDVYSYRKYESIGNYALARAMSYPLQYDNCLLLCQKLVKGVKGE